MKLTRILSILVVCLFLGTNVFAFGVPSFGGGGDSGVDVAALEDDQSALLKQVTEALLNLAVAQGFMAEALDLKEEAAIAAQNSDALESGDLTGSDDMEKQISSSQDVNDAIQAKLGESETLTEEGKAKFVEALPSYGKGAGGVVSSGKMAMEKAESLSGTKDFTVLKKLGPLLSYSKKSPELIKGVTTSTGTIIKFCTANGIDTSSLEAETAGW